MSQMKVGTRLIAAFFCVALMGAIVAGIGIFNMGKIDAMAGQMYHNELLGLSHIKEANIALIKVGRARSNFLLATTAEERATRQADWSLRRRAKRSAMSLEDSHATEP